MNGRGVFLSKKMGKLIATLEPRRRRILAVSVLYLDAVVLGAHHWHVRLTGSAHVDSLSLRGGKGYD